MYFPLSTIDELQDRKFNTKMNRYLNFNTKDISRKNITQTDFTNSSVCVFIRSPQSQLVPRLLARVYPAGLGCFTLLNISFFRRQTFCHDNTSFCLHSLFSIQYAFLKLFRRSTEQPLITFFVFAFALLFAQKTSATTAFTHYIVNKCGVCFTL